MAEKKIKTREVVEKIKDATTQMPNTQSRRASLTKNAASKAKQSAVPKTRTASIEPIETADTKTASVDVEQMMKESTNNILKYAEESLQSQMIGREAVIQLL